MLVGAGTVLTEAQVDAAVEAGAKFIISPGFDPELVQYCIDKGVAVYPGCTTPSEYQAALRKGLKVVKFFPAEQAGGLAKIKAMSAPFPMLKIIPTGGVSLKNLKDYVSCKAVCACGGSYMAPTDLVENGKWDEIVKLCRDSIEIVKEARNG
ncbi:MAG: bifunctional 4-hydroxy-2-oxoglutarate aldolase/2-dehydro-3-deoxy-phosphogluconate aldolase, partial [Firmicutes bacterium]|nr:bifunctional 4-hydroxy-2-oxoglutarate aldolase/2-dehydro-3-deoxy-phosphogluconate aldolase [Candidatus Colimorpha enterica]